jgi:small GTP-binding protein
MFPECAAPSLKVVLVGDQFVGKTSILNYLVEKRSLADVRATNSMYLTLHQMIVHGAQYTLHIWDTAGEEKYRSLASVYLRNARAVLVVFDITIPSSFNSVDYWLTYIRDTLNPPPAVIIVGNKCDITDKPIVDRETVRVYCQSRGVPLVYTSAATGQNIELCFADLTEKILENTAFARQCEHVRMSYVAGSQRPFGCDDATFCPVYRRRALNRSPRPAKRESLSQVR